MPVPVLALLIVVITNVTILLLIRRRLCDTTLVAPWIWALATTAVSGGNAVCSAWASSGSHLAASNQGVSSPLQYVLIVSMYCPLMSLLGSSKPQHRAWNFIVVTLWIMLAIPAASAIWIPSTSGVALPTIVQLFLILLTAMTAICYWGTRFWLCGIFVSAAILLEFREYWTILPVLGNGDSHLAAQGCNLAALLFAIWRRIPFGAGSHMSEASSPTNKFARVNETWLGFRDAFGVFWAFRVMERVNTSARINDWPIHMGWNGIELTSADDTSLPEETKAGIIRTIRNLLRRFYSPSILDKRLGSG